MVAHVCDRCGYAVGVHRVMLMVDGRGMNEHHFCQGCLTRVFDLLQSRIPVNEFQPYTVGRG